MIKYLQLSYWSNKRFLIFHFHDTMKVTRANIFVRTEKHHHKECTRVTA